MGCIIVDKYRLRRAILDAVMVQEPGLATLERIEAYPLLRMGGEITLRQIPDEVKVLVEHGFLLNCRPGREPLLRLTSKGRDQMDQEADLDECIWGDMASKFHCGGEGGGGGE